MPPRKRWLPKVLSYYLPLAETDPQAAMESMRSHWSGFSWLAGPVVVRWCSDVSPDLHVWAASEAEGKRVLRHCLSHVGLNETQGEWLISFVENKRCGSVFTVHAKMVSARPTADGVTPHLPII
jgi:hypothetical protein